MGGGGGGNFGNTSGKKKSVLDSISDFLTLASLVPGADTFVDAAAIPVDMLRGDWVSVGLDLLGVIPLVGEVGDTAKLAKMADKATDAFQTGRKTKNIINKQRRGTPRNNRAQNKQTNSVSKKLKLSPKQQRELHDLIHGQNWGYQEILENAKEWFNK